jgi:hypothetical protein
MDAARLPGDNHSVGARIRAGWLLCVGVVIVSGLGHRWPLELVGSIPLVLFGCALAANLGGFADRAAAARVEPQAEGEADRRLRERVRLQGALGGCVGLVTAAYAIAQGLGLGSSALFR